MKAIRYNTWLFAMMLAGAQAHGQPPVTPTASPAVPELTETTSVSSPWYTELERLVQAGVAEDVLLTFVDSAGTFSLDADRIISLRDQGVSNAVLNTILQHDAEIAQGLRQESPSTSRVPAPLVFAKPDLQAPSAPSASPAPFKLVFVKPDPLTTPPPPPPLQTDGSIIGTPAEPDEDLLAGQLDPEEMVYPQESQGTKLSSVRDPYPVKLTDTIVVLPLALRTPNVHVLISFP